VRTGSTCTTFNYSPNRPLAFVAGDDAAMKRSGHGRSVSDFGPSSDLAPALAGTADQLSAQVAQLSAALEDHASTSARLTARHVALARTAAGEAEDAVVRAKTQHVAFVAAAQGLRAELSALHELEAAVKDVLDAVGQLEMRADTYAKSLAMSAQAREKSMLMMLSSSPASSDAPGRQPSP
jgi:hypothetical protein